MMRDSAYFQAAFVLSVSLAMTSCRSPSSPNDEAKPSASAFVSASASAAIAAPPAASASASAAPSPTWPELTVTSLFAHALAGQVAGKPVHLNLFRQKNDVLGFYSYDGHAGSLHLRGTISGAHLELTESDSAGKITGLFRGDLKDHARSLDGVWAKPGKQATDDATPFSLHAEAAPTASPAPVKADRAKLTDLTITYHPKDSDFDAKAILPQLDGLSDESAAAEARRWLDPRGYLDLEIPAEKSLISLTQLLFAQGRSLAGLRYDLSCNAGHIFSALLIEDTMGAYPDTVVTRRTLDLRTGRMLASSEILAPESRDKLAALVNVKVRAAIDKSLREHAADLKDFDSYGDALKSVKFTGKDLDAFTVTPKGMTFWLDFGFPHVIQALEPTSSYPMTFAELAPFLRPGNPLADLAAH